MIKKTKTFFKGYMATVKAIKLKMSDHSGFIHILYTACGAVGSVSPLVSY